MNIQQRVPDSDNEASSGLSEPGRFRRAFGGIGRFVRRRPWFTGITVVAVIAGIAYASTRSGEKQAGEAIIATAERADVENVVTAVGNLQPLRFVDVGAQVSGQLKKLYVQPGAEVQKDQLLAEIDATV